MSLLANIIALFHGIIFIPLLILSPFVFWFSKKRYKWLEWAFIVAAVATGFNTLFLDYCLLSYWEHFFREQVNPAATYTEGFVVHWFTRAGIYWTDQLTTLVGGAFIAFGALGLWQKNIKS